MSAALPTAMRAIRKQPAGCSPYARQANGRLRWCWVVAGGAVFLLGCDPPRPVAAPIPTQFHASDRGRTGELVVFLPGLGDDMASFERAGFIDLLRKSPRPMDSIVVDAHIGYYIKDSLDERIYEDVLLPYTEKGYSRFFLVGTSLGALGSIGLSHAFGDRFAGMVLLAPYLGEASLIEEIESAGGVRAWKEQLDYPPEHEGKAWMRIGDMLAEDTQELPATLLAFGSKDRYAGAARLLARSIPDGRVFTNDGGHKWTAWTSLWADILQSDSWKTLGDPVE